jgi:prephenate dehydrogenase
MARADSIATSATEAVCDADIVLLAMPLAEYRPVAEAIIPALKPGAIITDVGSVKSGVAALFPDITCIPAHPIAGSEKSGVEAATADLFRDRLCILTPEGTADAASIDIIQTLWHAVGADVLHMPAAVHDQIYAHVSHLPHYIAFVSAHYFNRAGLALSTEDITLRQFLRISTSNPRMWCDIALANREMLLPALATYIALLEHFATELRAGEKTESAQKQALKLVPRILASSLVSGISLYEQQSGMALRPFAGNSLRDIVAPVATTSPEDDTAAISGAATAIADHLDALIVEFKTLERPHRRGG